MVGQPDKTEGEVIANSLEYCFSFEGDNIVPAIRGISATLEEAFDGPCGLTASFGRIASALEGIASALNRGTNSNSNSNGNGNG